MLICLIIDDLDRLFGIMMMIERDSLLKLVMILQEVIKSMTHTGRNATQDSSSITDSLINQMMQMKSP